VAAVALDEDKQELIVAEATVMPRATSSVNSVKEPKQPAAGVSGLGAEEFAMRTSLGAGLGRLMGSS